MFRSELLFEEVPGDILELVAMPVRFKNIKHIKIEISHQKIMRM